MNKELQDKIWLILPEDIKEIIFDTYNALIKQYNFYERYAFYAFVPDMSKYCGSIATIIYINNDAYILDIDNSIFCWTNEMFEEHIKDMKTKEIVLPEGWEVDKIENGKIVLKETKKELPKTWEECYKALGKGEFICDDSTIIEINRCINPEERVKKVLPTKLGKSMLALCQLLICREVYRQGWKPDYNNDDDKYCINTIENKIYVTVYRRTNRILSFQTEEIVNEFLKNFKDLIEEAKELI